jgi:hypothetical protein
MIRSDATVWPLRARSVAVASPATPAPTTAMCMAARTESDRHRPVSAARAFERRGDRRA